MPIISSKEKFFSALNTTGLKTISFASFLATRLLYIKYKMLMIAIAKKMIVTKDGTNKNKIPKPIEIMVNRIAIKEIVALFCSFLICSLSSSFN